jgi:hypothetical protein
LADQCTTCGKKLGKPFLAIVYDEELGDVHRFCSPNCLHQETVALAEFVQIVGISGEMEEE